MICLTFEVLSGYFSYCINVKLFTYGLQIILQNILHLTFPMMFILQKLYRVSLLEFLLEGELGRERVEVIKAITADGDFCHGN